VLQTSVGCTAQLKHGPAKITKAKSIISNYCLPGKTLFPKGMALVWRWTKCVQNQGDFVKQEVTDRAKSPILPHLIQPNLMQLNIN
jgi:hypothetical protein